MGRSLLALFVVSVAAAAFGAPAIDAGREERLAQEIVPSLVVGDAVWLATPARPKVLAILTEPSAASKGGVIVIHGLGVHPDCGLIGGVRTGLADAGYTTLSVQMPVLSATASRDDYAVTLPAAGDRIAAAIAFLQGRGVAKIAIVSHSLGATMANAYLARPGAFSIDAWVPVGMAVDFAAPPKEPVLDVTAETRARRGRCGHTVARDDAAAGSMLAAADDRRHRPLLREPAEGAYRGHRGVPRPGVRRPLLSGSRRGVSRRSAASGPTRESRRRGVGRSVDSLGSHPHALPARGSASAQPRDTRAASSASERDSRWLASPRLRPGAPARRSRRSPYSQARAASPGRRPRRASRE